ncbi:MAG: acyltransferase family protein [Candidatus Neomarinimicrobiota bacterium]
MKASRLHSLDAMRAIMVLLGILLHLSLVFATFSNPFKLNSNSGHFIFDIMYVHIHYFRMPAFFMISGFFSSLLYYNKSPKKMLLNRFKRIFLPLVVFIYPLWIFNAYARQTSILQNEGLSPFNALIDGFKVFNKTEALFPWITIHLWFLYLLFFMSISVFIAKIIFNRNNILNKKFKQIISLVFLKPWLGSFLLALIYGLFISLLNKLEAQGGGQWMSWVWFIDLAGSKTFLAFSFFYFTGWSIYRYPL